jgi:hypothetical protein
VNKSEPFDSLAQIVRYPVGYVVVGRRHDDGKFLPAVSSGEIGRTGAAVGECTGDGAKAIVAFLVTVQIIV